MNSHRRDIELESRIDAYIKGKLSEKQVDKLWVELLKRPEYIDLLQTEIDLVRLYRLRRKQQKKSGSISYWKWTAAAAAVVLLVVSVSLFSTSNSDSIDNWTQDSINLLDNLASAQITRSDANVASSDSVLNTAFKAAINGNTEEARDIYEMILQQRKEPHIRSKANLNLGILYYNEEDFEESIDYFRQAIDIDQLNPLQSEQSYWFLGSALANIGEYADAREAVQAAYAMGKIHKSDAYKLLEQLDRELGNNPG